MKKLLSGIIVFSVIITAFVIQSSAAALSLSSLVQKGAPLTLSQLEDLIKQPAPDSAIAIEIQRRRIAFPISVSELARLKRLGAGPKTIQALQARLKPEVKPPVQTLPQADASSHKVIILVANFDGPNPQEYRVTEHIIEHLDAATKKYSDIDVQPLRQTITVQQGGSEVARDIGTKRKASIVLWGYYAANREFSYILTHFEVLREQKLLNISQSTEKQTATISELRKFEIQTKLSGEMAYLALLTVGLARYESGD